MSPTSDELTPLVGSPVLVLGKRRRRAASRPKSLVTGETSRLTQVVPSTSPMRRALRASIALGFGVSIMVSLAVVALPGLHIRAKASLALLGLIYAIFYLSFGMLVRRNLVAVRMQWAATLAEALLPSAALAILAALDLRPSIVTFVPVYGAALLVCATRLSPYSVVFGGILGSSCLGVSLLYLDIATLGQLLAPMAWLALLTAAIAGAANYMRDFLFTISSQVAHAQRLETELGRYLSPEVAEAIVLDQHRAPEKRKVSVLFCDLRGFTFLCERERPEDVVELLNTLYEGACRIISANGGSVNKFLGDGLLAIFGDQQVNHTEQAAAAAIEMQQWIRFLRERGGIWTHVAMGIGIDTGDVVAGPVGGANRREYTVIGPAVNRAARLQAFAERDYQRIVLSQAATDSLPATLKVRSLGTVELKGFARAEAIFALHQESAT